jgi:hypothetical protein
MPSWRINQRLQMFGLLILGVDVSADVLHRAVDGSGVGLQVIRPIVIAHKVADAILAHILFWLNVGLYAILLILLLVRTLRYRGDLAADLASHARAPGFFTLVAASSSGWCSGCR